MTYVFLNVVVANVNVLFKQSLGINEENGKKVKNYATRNNYGVFCLALLQSLIYECCLMLPGESGLSVVSDVCIGRVSNWDFLTSFTITGTHVGLRVKFLLLLSDFNQNWNVQTNFSRTSKYKILCKYILWFCSCDMQQK
jgi:hypothetical protein